MQLVIVNGPEKGKVFELVPGQNFIGRADENSVVLPSGQVSRRHACVSLVDGRAFLEDLGSSNGTFVQGKRVDGKIELPPGVPFQVGEFTLQWGNPAQGVGPGAESGPVGASPGGEGAPFLPQSAPMPSHLANQHVVESPFWSFYAKIHFLGWRGQMVLLAFFSAVLIALVGIYPLLLKNQEAMKEEVVKRAKVLVSKLALRNGEFIKDRKEINLDTSFILAEEGVTGAYLLNRQLSILSPVEQRGRKKDNVVSRGALTQGFTVKDESEFMEKGEAGVLHLAMPIKVWTEGSGNYETYGVAYLVFNAKKVAEVNSATESKFVSSAVVVIVVFLGFLMVMMLLTVRPISALRDDTELALRGDVISVESRARWKELSALAASINRSLSRSRQVGPLGAGGASPSAPVPGPPATSSASSVTADAKIRAVANAVQESVVITDDLQRVVFLNRNAERLFGVPLNRVKDRHIMEVISSQEILGAVLDLLKELINSDELSVAKTVPVSEGGRAQTLNVVASGVKNASKQLEYAAIVIQ